MEAPGIFAGGLVLLWLLMTVGAVVGWVLMLVAMWRAMRAHESIAQSIRRIADK